MGNPTTYKGNAFTWEQGRKLTSGSMNGKSFSYAYDGNGMRYKRTVNGATTNYYYDGTQLLMESRDAERIWYVYGSTGIEGFSYQYEIYYELKEKGLIERVCLDKILENIKVMDRGNRKQFPLNFILIFNFVI